MNWGTKPFSFTPVTYRHLTQPLASYLDANGSLRHSPNAKSLPHTDLRPMLPDITRPAVSNDTVACVRSSKSNPIRCPPQHFCLSKERCDMFFSSHLPLTPVHVMNVVFHYLKRCEHNPGSNCAVSTTLVGK